MSMAALGIVSRMRFVVWAFLYISNVYSFNLDTRIPILKQMSNGDGSYFGFSVAQHQINDPNNPGAILENV